MKPILPYLISTLIVYFCFAFILWKCNPSQWEQSARAMFIYCWLAVSVITGLFTNIKKINL